MGKAYEKELETIIKKIVDIIARQDMDVEIELRKWIATDEETLEKLGSIAELKIKRKQISQIRKEIKKIIDTSTNRLILSTRDPANN